jgi:hypothetical protein
MNIEHDEFVIPVVSDDALEQAAGGVGGLQRPTNPWWHC